MSDFNVSSLFSPKYALVSGKEHALPPCVLEKIKASQEENVHAQSIGQAAMNSNQSQSLSSCTVSQGIPDQNMPEQQAVVAEESVQTNPSVTSEASNIYSLIELINLNSILSIALQNGNVDVINNYSLVLRNLPAHKRAELLAAKDVYGNPGLYFALQGGHAAAITAWGKLLELVSENECVELLSAKDMRGNPAMSAALKNGHADALEAWGKLLRFVPKRLHAELIAGRDPIGVPGMLLAIKHDKTDALMAWCDLLDGMLENQLMGLLVTDRVHAFKMNVFLMSCEGSAKEAYFTEIEPDYPDLFKYQDVYVYTL